MQGLKNVYLFLRHGHSWANEKHLIVSTMVRIPCLTEKCRRLESRVLASRSKTHTHTHISEGLILVLCVKNTRIRPLVCKCNC